MSYRHTIRANSNIIGRRADMFTFDPNPERFMAAKLRFFHIRCSHWRSLIDGFVLMLPFMMLLSSCFDEEFVPGQALDLRFSQDTLRFDTVFTTLGSATRGLRIVNLSDENVTISSVRLAEGEQSKFRLNVDGIPGKAVNDVSILAKDSVHVFVEVTIDPDEPLSISPFVITESLIVESGGSQQIAVLEAWGQNANYFPSRDARGEIIGLSCNGGEIVWNDPRPYVVYGLLFIDSCSLVIPAGTRVHVHGGIARQDELIFEDGGLFFLENGKLISQGTAESPVIFQGSRLEPSFEDVPGQWAGIRFINASRDNLLEHTIIKNSIVGVRVDSAASVQLDAVQIFNTSGVGLVGVYGSIQADNTIIHSNGPQSVALAYGGNYNFRYCTIANYQNQSAALYMDNFTCVDEDCASVIVNPLNAYFLNSIIMGSNDEEVTLVDASEGSDPDLVNLTFDHTLIRAMDNLTVIPDGSCQECLVYNDEPVFVDENDDNYQLDTMSVAIGQGVFIDDLPLDIIGKMRDGERPDLGCYEF